MSTRHSPGYALATILILMSVAMFGVGALISISSLESKISRSQKEGITAYYVGEAGAQDAVWRISKNFASFSDMLQQGTLSVAYSSPANIPEPGQHYTVTIATTSQGPGYAQIDVIGYADNGTFVAQRHVQAKVFQGTPTSPNGNNAILTGGSFAADTNKSAINVDGGNLYASQGYNINQNGSTGTANFNGNQILVRTGSTNPSSCNTVIICGGITVNPPVVTVPGFDFSTTNSGNPYSIAAANGACYGLAAPCKPLSQFDADMTGNKLPNSPVIYVNGNVSFYGNPYKNKTRSYTGMLVIVGSLNWTTSNFNLTINDSGTGRAGLFVSGSSNITATTGSLTVNGIVYNAQGLSLPGNIPWTITGALVTAGNINLQPGANLNITYNNARFSNTFGGGIPSLVQTQHWEEEY